jgi:hypothetical protein
VLEVAELDERIGRLEERRLPLPDSRRRRRLAAATLVLGAATATVAPALFEPQIGATPVAGEPLRTPSQVSGEEARVYENGDENGRERARRVPVPESTLRGMRGFAEAACVGAACKAPPEDDETQSPGGTRTRITPTGASVEQRSGVVP